MSNTCLHSDAAPDEFFKEEFNADITKVINCSAVCRSNPECTNREAHGAAEILPLTFASIHIQEQKSLLGYGVPGSTGVSKRSVL